MLTLTNEVEKFVKKFKKKIDFEVDLKTQMNKILISKKYNDFINLVYDYYNSKVEKEFSGEVPKNERLHIQCYADVDKTINYFWELLLGKKVLKKFHSNIA